VCMLTLSQAGNDDTFPAPSINYNGYVYPAGPTSSDLSRLGGVFPPGGATQSLIRLYNVSSSNPSTISLFDGTTGEKVLTWTGPSIAIGTAQQFSIADLESAALPGFKRPAVYGLKLESGYARMQHVLFNPDAGVITNASSCSGGIEANPN